MRCPLNSLYIGFTMSTEAVWLIWMCLMFSHCPRIPDGVKIKATYSALQTWIELFSVTSGKRTESHVPYYTDAWSVLCFYPHFCFWEFSSQRSRDPELPPTPSHRCRVSLYDFIINGCQCVAQERKAARSTRSQLCHFGATSESI